jgi:hypothetical protein
MFKIPDSVLAQLRAGTASALTPDEAKEVARYIDTLATLDQVPALLKVLSVDVLSLKTEIKTAAAKQAEAIRMQRRDQRAV